MKIKELIEELNRFDGNLEVDIVVSERDQLGEYTDYAMGISTVGTAEINDDREIRPYGHKVVVLYPNDY